MKVLVRILLLSIIATVLVSGLQAQELSKEQWQAQMNEVTAKRDDLRNKLNAVQKEIDDLKKQEVDKDAALKACQDETAKLAGEFESTLNEIDNKLNELSRLSNQDLLARKAEVDAVQAMIDKAKQHPLAAVPRYADRISGAQVRLDALKRTLKEMMEAKGATYTVGTWARDRDCLWNIAKKPKIYDNAFLWPKIWQGNRDQIKNPDIIQPGQKLKIPPKAPLTSEEKAAERSYWNKKR